jgi:hypothetical protein
MSASAFVRGSERHRNAVAMSLSRAEEAAARGDHADALSWLDVVEATGDELREEYRAKRRQWLATLARAQACAGPARSRGEQKVPR